MDRRVLRSENKTVRIQLRAQGLFSPGWAVLERPQADLPERGSIAW